MLGRKAKPVNKQWVIREPWKDRAYDQAMRLLVCSWRGHQRTLSFSGSLKTCRRCGH